MTAREPTLRDEIGKKRPFELPEQEAYLNLVRTTAVLQPFAAALCREHGLTDATFNVLRILRGATLGEPAGRRSCSEIGRHLVAQVPDVTRLVDRLIEQGLVERERSPDDRRVVHVRITKKGLDLLARMDKAVLDMHERQLGHMTRADLAELNRLLVKARAPHQEHEGHAP